MQLNFAILSLALVASAMAFPMAENEANGMFEEEGRQVMSLFNKLSPATKEAIGVIHNNTELTRAAEESAVNDLFAGSTVNAEDKTAYDTIKSIALSKEAEFTAAIDKAVADSSLTETQKALYKACKDIYQNKTLTIKQTKEELEAVAAAADKVNVEDRKAVEQLIKETVQAQLKATSA
uniref:DUF148 domain-containing protein n=1 Tax=Rhabditophanes sp. KR3021 TaxID=114890 RepID=A0AC35UC87_9BILA